MESVILDVQECEQTPESLYFSAKIQHYPIEDATIAVRVYGRGPAIVLLHGYPVHGYTWRHLLPTLSAHFTCYVIDLPGLGDSDWSEDTDFGFIAQARRLELLFRALKLNKVAIVAHDTGATIGRLVAQLCPSSISKLVMLNTEIPGHRPPWIRLYQFMAKIPLSHIVFQLFMSSTLFIRSSMGLGQFYTNRKLFASPDYIDPYVRPLVSNTRRLGGALNYLKGIDWQAVDRLQEGHKSIKAEVLFLWGENDRTFPVAFGEVMCEQFQVMPEFIKIPSASLMPHEEKPKEVLKSLLPFLRYE